MIPLFDQAAGWVQESLLLPALYALGLMEWEDVSFGWALFAVYGLVQVVVTFAICLPLERWRPVERWAESGAVVVDVIYTLISRVGLLPLITFVLFYKLQVGLNGWMADQGWVPPTLERIFPFLLGQQVATFLLYVIILDFFDYWRHRLSHVFTWWYSLHALHHAQRQMTFWSDDRNHLLDDVIGFAWFTAIALLIGIPPMQFPLLVLVLRLLESLSHANARISFGWLGERLLVGPRFHRLHHALSTPAERHIQDHNFAPVFPIWDILFGTAIYDGKTRPTGVDDAVADADNGRGWIVQQVTVFGRFVRALMPRLRRRAPAR